MTSRSRNAGPTETPLEQGFRRYAPAEAGGRRMALTGFVASLLRSPSRPPDRSG